MRITEIFYSIQGESSYAGLPCAFVRLTWCNLRCTWCDSEYTFAGGTEMSVEEVMEQVRDVIARRRPCTLVTFFEDGERLGSQILRDLAFESGFAQTIEPPIAPNTANTAKWARVYSATNVHAGAVSATGVRAPCSRAAASNAGVCSG